MLQTNQFKIYNASAGSGKTYTLVNEFLSLLLTKADADAFRNLLAITFTNKAANEMKERIIQKLKFLSDAEHTHAEMQQLVQETGLKPETVQQRSQKILSSILHNYGLFAVSTIDKFNLRLMRAFSQDMGLSINFDVEMDAQQLFAESVELLLSELQENHLLAKIMAEIAIENLIDNRKWDISKEMVMQSGTLFQDKFLDQLKILQKVSLEDFNAFRKEVNQKYFVSKNGIEDAANSFLDFAQNHGLTYNDFKGKSRGSILKYFEQVANGDYKLFSENQLKQLDERTFFTTQTMDEETLVFEIEQAYKKVVQHLIQYNFWNKIRKKINPITLYNEVEKKLNHVKSENNLLLISEFNKIISDNIQDQPAPFIYEKIGNRYHHYFIDEFQDTSDLQWNNLLPLLENAFAQDETVMIVGDPKQSIYRWRGGNPQLMLSLSQEHNERISVENLPTNWRSYDEVIKFNNHLYSFVSNQLTNDAYRQLFANATQNKNTKQGGFVQLRIEEKPKRGSGISFLEICMEKLLEDIKTAESQDFAWNEMAILVRKNSEGHQIAEFLSQNGYQVLSNESLLLNNAEEVQLLLIFIRYLAEPELDANRVHLVLNLIHNQIIQVDDVSTFLVEISSLTPLEFIQKMKNEGVDFSFVEQPFQSLYDQVSACVRAVGWNEKANAYVTFFMDEVLKFQYQQDTSPDAFLQYWELKGHKLSVVVPEGQNAIRLMTIHKSKGLQFPVVFLPYVTWNPQASGIWIPTENETIPYFYIEDLSMPEFLSDELQNLIAEEEAQAELDALNMLYVATTRAVEQLYITTEMNGKTPKPVSSYLNDFFNLQEEKKGNLVQFGNMQRVSKKAKRKSNQQVIVPFVSGDWTKKVMISKEHRLLWNEERAKAINYGKKMHAVLEKINAVSETNEVLHNFELQGFINEEEKEIIQDELQILFSETALKKVFEADEFFNERDFISPNGMVFRPDRLVKVEDAWILLDYKTGETKNKDIQQVQQYAKDLTDLGFAISKKYLIYLGQEDGIVEVP